MMMAPTNQRFLPVFLLFTAALLVLCTNLFASHDVFTVMKTSLHRRSLYTVSTAGDFVPTNGLTSGKTHDVLPRKKAVPFGSREILIRNNSRRANVRRTEPEPVTITYDEAVRQGHVYWNALAGPRAETFYNNYHDLVGPADESYGWSVRRGVTVGEDDNDVPFLDPFLDLDILLEAQYNEDYRVTQDLPFVNCRGVTCNPTEARNWAVHNPTGKTIVSYNNFSPNYFRRLQLQVDKLSPEQALTLPRVTQWSDIIWILWRQICGTAERAAELKYIFKENVITSNTRFIMEKCFDNVQPDTLDEEWPGEKYGPQDEQFYALLGTPHGRGIVYLLYQHPYEMPGKSIESITVFTIQQDPHTEYHLLFTLTGPGNPPIDHSPSPPP